MIVFTADGDRDLKGKEAVAAMVLPAGAGAGKKKKKKQAGASESELPVPLARLLPNESTAEARPAGAGKKMQEATAEKKMKEATAEKKTKEAVASESVDGALGKEQEKEKEKEKEGDSLFKEGEMLKLREEFWEAERLWREKLVPGALDRWLKRKKSTAQLPPAKKKKVVRVILPDDYIDYIKENPDMMSELSDEEMARLPEPFRQTYAIKKVINAKNRAYQQALTDQYRAFGFAYDEMEVTDDDEEATVKKS